MPNAPQAKHSDNASQAHSLHGKTILLGVTGGIAAYKSAELVRLLKKNGANVIVVLTEAGAQFITPTTMQALSGNPVYSNTWDLRMEGGMAHIDLSRHCDAILIAPASADFIAKLAHGHADDLLSTLCLAKTCPLWVAPAMNVQMWNHPATQRNLRQIEQDGCLVFGPAAGEQACGEVGQGRMLEAAELLESVYAAFTAKVLAGKKVLITAGPTYEPIDPVRGITNRSSGKMGYAIAQAAFRAGAEVTLISGPTALAATYGVKRIDVTTAKHMLAAVLDQVADQDIFISVAAVADWTVKAPSSQKLKKSQQISLRDIEFEENPDILATVAKMANQSTNKLPFCVGFAAETENLDQYAQKKLREKNIPMVVGNFAQNTLGSNDVEIAIFGVDNKTVVSRRSKLDAALELIRVISTTTS
jgi:phosphopantothenoylcysteine decarboxylase/phosphopantothenate--cysteine ligase